GSAGILPARSTPESHAGRDAGAPSKPRCYLNIKSPDRVSYCAFGITTSLTTGNTMRNSILKFGAMTYLAAAIAASLVVVSAQTTNKPAGPKKAAAEKTDPGAKKAHSFHGNLAAVDRVAKTITIGKST